MAYLDDIDQRQVKKGKFGPLDVFPQEEKQREDELNAENVKNGFKYIIPDLLKEYEFQSLNLKDSTNFENDVYRSLISILNKREDINNASNDAGKKQIPNKLLNPFKPQLLHITTKSKETVVSWFKSLADNDSLMKLAKKIPVFNKRHENLPEIILTLSDYNVPITRSVWYIKMLAAQVTNLNEVQKKKRQTNLDPSNEWTLPLVKFLRELFNRMKETINQPNHVTQVQQHQQSMVSTIESFMTNDNNNSVLLTMSEDKLKNLWDYATKLMRAMLDQNLLDKQLILDFIIDLLEKSRLFDKNLKYILTIVVQNINHFLQSELLSRRLAYYCCRKLSSLFNDQIIINNENKSQSDSQQKGLKLTTTATTSSPTQQNEKKEETPTKVVKKPMNFKVCDIFKQYHDCSQHKDVIILLTSITHSIVLGCTQALIWNEIGDGKECPFNGSPLDFLPCLPSELLFTYNHLGSTKEYIKFELEKAELCIRRRSIAIENKWSTEQLDLVAEMTDSKILAMLDLLDKNSYDYESLENIYIQLFKKPVQKDEKSQIMSEKSIVHLLCEWAITTKRTGLHRAFYVVLLLRKRQKELAKEIYSQKRKLQQKLRLSIMKEAKILKKLKRSILIEQQQQQQQQKESQLLSNSINIIPAPTPIQMIKEEIMDIDKPQQQQQNDTSLNNQQTSSNNEIVNNNNNKMSTDLNKKQTNNSDNKKVVKKRKKKPKMTSAQKYEFEIQELSNSFLLQNILVEYLEIKSNYLDDNSTESRLQFTNLITLFYLFINFKLFSHNSFICTLISRGEIFRNSTNDDYKDIMSVPASGIGSVKNPQSVQSISHYQNMDSRKSIDYGIDSNTSTFMHHYQHQKSIDSVAGGGGLPSDVFTDESMVQESTQHSNNNQLSKLTNIILNLPLPQNDAYQHERNQRSIILFGFGTKRQEVQKKTRLFIKDLLVLFNTKSSIDLNEILSSSKFNAKLNTKEKIFQVQDNINNSEIHKELIRKYQQLSHYDQYYIISFINDHILSQFKNVQRTNILPSLLNIQFIFDLMEYNNNIINILIFSIRLIKIIPQFVENYLFKNSSLNHTDHNRTSITNYVSLLYFNIVSVLKLYLPCLVLWHDLTIQVFKSLYNVIKHIDTPKKCSSHEKCIFLFMNELYASCNYIKEKFPKYKDYFDKLEKMKSTANKEKDGPDKSLIGPYQVKIDEKLISMISKTDYTIEQIEAYVSEQRSYNFVAQVFLYISKEESKEEVTRIAYLCGEITSRLHFMVPLWQLAIKALCSRGDVKDKPAFSEIASKINILNSRVKDNFQIFFCSLIGSNSLILHDFIIAIVRTCVIASPHCNKPLVAQTADSSHSSSYVESCALFACQIIKFLCTSSPKSLQFRTTSFSQRLLISNFRSMSFNTFLLILKGLFLLSPYNDNNSGKSDSKKKAKLSNDSNLHNKNSNSDEHCDINQFAGLVLQEICSQDWIKERCLKEGENLLKPVHLLESALQKPQTLLRIICYPENHHLRNINDQITSTKDVIRNILQNLDIWTLRESLLELKLMIETQKSKDCHYDHLVKCLAKTTVDLLIDPEIAKSNILRHDSTISSNNLNTSITNANNINANTSIGNNGQNLGTANNNDDAQISFHLNDNLENETNPNIQSTTPPSSSSSLSNLDPQSNADPLNIPSVGKTSTIDNNDLNDNNNNNEFNNKEEMNDYGAFNGSSSNIDLFDMNNYKPHREPRGIWLIASLITKLQEPCQTRILEHASSTLQELGKSFWIAKTKTEKETQAAKNITAWSQPPFFSLLLTCIKCQEEQKPLLTSLFNQLNDFITGKDDKTFSEDPKLKLKMMSTLHIRLSLVGKMFDFILKNQSEYASWAWLFVQLIHLGVVDPDTDQLLFTMVIDMLAVLIHHIISIETNLESNRFYQLIVKRISKDTFSDLANSKAINQIRRLLPLNRITTADLITVEAYSSSSSKNNLLEKRKGYKFSRKERVSNWELIEGVKNASSLCLSWYGANKLERKMLRYEYQQKLLIRHSHGNIQKDSNYFKEMPEVPNDIIIINEQPKVVVKQIEQQNTNINQFTLQQQQQQLNSPNMIQQTPNSMQMHSNNNQMQSMINNQNMMNNSHLSQLNMNQQQQQQQQQQLGNLMNQNIMTTSGLNMMNNKPIGIGQMQTPNNVPGGYQNMLNNNPNNQMQINNNTNLMLQNSLLNSKNVMNNPGIVGVPRVTPEKQRGGGNTGSARKPKQARGGARATRTPSNQQPPMSNLTATSTQPIMMQNANPLVNQNPNWQQQQQQLQNNNLPQQHGLYGQTNGPTNSQPNILHNNQTALPQQQPASINQLQHNPAMRQTSWNSQMGPQQPQQQPLGNSALPNAYPTQAQTPNPQTIPQQQQYLSTNQPFNQTNKTTIPANTTFLRQTLQPNNNRMNYPNIAPGNTQIQQQQQNNDVTIINAPNIQKPQQAVPQQPIATNKRKFSETSSYPTQPTTANPAIIQQQQNFPQNTPQTRILSAAQQNNSGNYGNFINDQQQQQQQLPTQSYNSTNQQADISTIQKPFANNNLTTNTNNQQQQNFNMQSSNRINQQQYGGAVGGMTVNNPQQQQQQQNLAWQQKQAILSRQQQIPQQQQPQQSQQYQQQIHPTQLQQQQQQQQFLQKQSSQVLTTNSNSMMQQPPHLQRHMTAPQTQYQNY